MDTVLPISEMKSYDIVLTTALNLLTVEINGVRLPIYQWMGIESDRS
ncbi:hypothetical protein ACIFOT_22695 [Neobacillus sp. NRS-1170]